nr:MAG TPA: hypothetical protein [Caudoviricetes sp.]
MTGQGRNPLPGHFCFWISRQARARRSSTVCRRL